jgi:uncharacterized protein
MTRKGRSINPFVFSRALSPDEAIGRGREVETLLGKLQGGHAVTLYAARRMGKTSLLKQLLSRAEREKTPGVLVDLSDVLSAQDVAVRLEQAFRVLPGRLGRLVGRELAALEISTPFGGVSVQRRQRGSLEAIHLLLEVPGKIAAQVDGRALVVLDEFQALIGLRGLDGVFRSHLQHQDQVGYVFCGSEPSLLRSLFQDRARPLFGQAEQVNLGRVPFDDAYDFIARRFEESGKDGGIATAELVALSQLHPQRLMLLAHFLWDQVGSKPASIADLRVAYDLAMRMVDQELRYLWEALTVNERRVLAALASDLSPYEAEARAMAGLATASSAQRAVEALRGRGILERAETGPVRVVDPLLTRWVRRHGGARLSLYVLPNSDGGFVVTDGPSLAFTRSEHDGLDEARDEADRLAVTARGADVMIFDTDDPNDLPGWAIG